MEKSNRVDRQLYECINMTVREEHRHMGKMPALSDLKAPV